MQAFNPHEDIAETMLEKLKQHKENEANILRLSKGNGSIADRMRLALIMATMATMAELESKSEAEKELLRKPLEPLKREDFPSRQAWRNHLRKFEKAR